MRLICYACATLALAAGLAGGEEIPGVISGVDQLPRVEIRTSSELLPAVGDTLTVFIEIPGVGKASIASGTIVRVDGKSIIARIEKATGNVKPGQLVSIRSEAAQSKPSVDGLAAWGKPVDPDGDCTFSADRGKLVITVGDGLHDLWYGRQDPKQRFNAPRVAQQVDGDFVVQVRVTAEWQPYRDDTNYGAGLLVWDSENHFVRHERHVFISSGKPACSPAPAYYRDNQNRAGAKLMSAEFFPQRSTWLRVARTGNRLATAISHDGTDWIDTGTLTTSLPGGVNVGVHVFKVSSGRFTAEFDEFALRRGSESESAPRARPLTVAHWGRIIDPDQTCRMSLTPERLTLTVPAGLTDLWYGRDPVEKRYNAPRVLQEVEGDFVARVKVTGNWSGTPQENGSLSRAAGLLIYESDRHYLRHERNRFISFREPGVAWSWTPPLYDRDEQRISQWRSQRDGGPFQGDSTWLLMQRTGQTVHTWISHDGKDWIHTGTHTTTFPAKVQVGLLAHGGATDSFSVTFEEFKLTKAK